MTSFLIRNNGMEEADRQRVIKFVDGLSPNLKWRVTVEQAKSQRSINQNRALWGLAYATIMREGGEALQGWDAEDLHEYFLGEWAGWEVAELFGKKRQRPIRRSSKLTKAEFADFFSFIQRKAAEFGVYIADPDPFHDIES